MNDREKDRRNPDFKPSRETSSECDRENNRRSKRKQNQRRLKKTLEKANINAAKLNQFASTNLDDNTDIDSLTEACKVSKGNASDRLADIISNLTNIKLNDATKEEIKQIIELIIDSVIYQLEIDGLIEENVNNR